LDLERATPDTQPRAESRASWCEIGPAVQYDTATAPDSGLVLVRVPPAVRAAPGRIELRLGRQILGDVDVALCPIVCWSCDGFPSRAPGRIAASQQVRAIYLRWNSGPGLED
jgi:hypothetical protein